MKTKILFLAIAYSTMINAQIINIPDLNFKARLLAASTSNNIASTIEPNDNGYVSTYNKIDVNNDGEIQVSEALLIKFLRVPGVNINDVTGVNAFVNLKYFNCANNQISDIDVSGLSKLRILHCHINQLNSLNIKNNNPNSWLTLEIFSNDNMTYICSDEDDITFVKNIALAYIGNYCNVNSYCSFTPGGTFYTIQGNQKIDFNNNGCDTNDSAYPNLKFDITDGTVSGSLISNNSGNYSIPVSAGTHTIIPQFENPTYFNASPTSATVSFPAATSPFSQNFCIAPNGVHHDLEVVVIPTTVARPGFDATYKIKYKNKGNQTENTALNFNYNDAILDYVSSTVMPTTLTTGTLSWNIGTISPFQSGEITVTLNVNSPMETPAVNGGDVLSYTATANGLNTDETPNDNTFTLNQVVVNSYDPNDKTCLEGTTISPSMIGKYIHYKIRFENTGTYPAQNIVVKDMIDTTKFDISTLQMTDASHGCVTKISNTNKVEFIFENINLPFDDANNDGYVVFKIKTKPTLVIGNTISNSANIYFDYNFPIVTNNYTTTIQNTLGLQENDFINNISVYPNPVKDILNFKTEHNISKVEVYDIAGRILSSNSVSENKIDLSELKTGNYILKLYTEKGIMNIKIIKE
jgi:Secretion system C-terminal sorting domain